jgi:hypothetical protein
MHRRDYIKYVGCGFFISKLTLSDLSVADELKFSQQFLDKLHAAHLVIDSEKFRGYVPAPMIMQSRFSYDFGLINQSINVEVRFAVHNLSGQPRNTLVAYASTAVMNMADKANGLGSGIISSAVFPQSGAQSEFGADWGASIAIRPDKLFADYDIGRVNVIIDDATSTIAFYLVFAKYINESVIFDRELHRIFYGWRFSK